MSDSTIEFGISCKCGHRDHYDNFTVSNTGKDLPKHHYQCPECGRAWNLKRVGFAQVLDNGMAIPADRVIVELNRPDSEKNQHR